MDRNRLIAAVASILIVVNLFIGQEYMPFSPILGAVLGITLGRALGKIFPAHTDQEPR